MFTILSELEDLAFSLGYKGYKLFDNYSNYTTDLISSTEIISQKVYKLFDNYSNYSTDFISPTKIVKQIDFNMNIFLFSYEKYLTCHKIS